MVATAQNKNEPYTKKMKNILTLILAVFIALPLVHAFGFDSDGNDFLITSGNINANSSEFNLDVDVFIHRDTYWLDNVQWSHLENFVARDSNGPKTIYIGAVELVASNALLITDDDNIKIKGCGIDCTNITVNKTTSTMGHTFKLDRSNNIEISHMTFRNDGVYQSGAIRIQEGPATNNYFHDLYIEGYDAASSGQSLSGIKVGDGGAADYSINNTLIERVTSIDNFRGLYLSTGTYNTIMRDVITKNNTKAGIETDAQNSFLSVVRKTLIDNHISEGDGQHCALFEGSVGVVYENSRCLDSGERGISVVHDVDFYTMEDIKISNNYIGDVGLEQIYLVTGLSSHTSEYTCIDDVTIIGNTLRRNESGSGSSDDGIKIRPYNGSSCEPTNIRIIGNSITNEGTLTVAEALELESSGGKRPWNVTVVGNYIDNTGYATSTPNPISIRASGNIGLDDVLISADGTHWTCGPDNSGVYSCS